MVIVIVQSAAAEGEDSKVDQGHENHDFPRIGFEQASEVFGDGRFLGGIGTDALSRSEKSDREKNEAQDSPNGHGHLPAILPIVTEGEFGDQGEGKAADDEL